jgi:hypothetical protein
MFELTQTLGQERVLDFDMETVAAGFADPAWVPQKITCIAWAWVDDPDNIQSVVTSPIGLYRPKLRAKMLRKFLRELRQATMVTGHNLLRFDLPILNAESIRCGLPKLEPIKVQDTMRITRTKGFKKGQDNVAGLLRTEERKKAMDWQQWEDAYEERGWPEVIDRCESDVRMHIQMRQGMIDRGWLKRPVFWTP